MNPSDLRNFDPLHGGCYPGGKSGSGIYQRLINLMPPHQVYIEPFLGGGAVLRYKLPAEHNIGIDRDPDVIARWQARAPQFPATTADERLRWQFLCADGIEFLRHYPWTGRELVYCDPPYLHTTRRDLKLYAYEMNTTQHKELLRVIRAIPVPVMISGYTSPLYQMHLEWSGWHATSYMAPTRRGMVEETLWCNFPPPPVLHDYRYLGEDRRERERLKRMQQSWARRLAGLGRLERLALLSVLNARALDAGSTAAEERDPVPRRRNAPSAILQPNPLSPGRG